MKLTKEEILQITKNIEQIEKEYLPDRSIFCENEQANRLMYRLNQLSHHEKRILILYAELNSYRKTAQALGISHTTIKNKIEEIRRKIR